MLHPPPETHCYGKVRYESGADAAKAMLHLKRKQAKPGGIYRCHYCHGHHIGRAPKANLKELKRAALYALRHLSKYTD